MKTRSTIVWCNLCLFYVSILQTGTVYGQGPCKKTGVCSCKSSKGTLDLTPLASTGSAKFPDLPDGGGTWRYSWNPCVAFSESKCTNVAVCQSSVAGASFNLGTQDTASFATDPLTGTITLAYSAFQEGTTRTSTITLTCDKAQEGSLVLIGEKPLGTGNFFFTLTSKYACINSAEISVSITISPGSMLCIIFFSVLFIYLVSGFSYQAFVRKASGKEMVPNYGLWTALPGLIKDGILFIVRCGKSGSYDKI